MDGRKFAFASKRGVVLILTFAHGKRAHLFTTLKKSKAKPQHWRAFHSIYAPKCSQMLGFRLGGGLKPG